MSNIIRIKRRAMSVGAQGAPSSLYNAELAYNEYDKKLYYGFGDNGSGIATSIIPIGGSGSLGTFVKEGKNVDISTETIDNNTVYTIHAQNSVLDLYELGVDNLHFNGNTISSTAGQSSDEGLSSDDNIYIEPRASGYLQVKGTNGLVIPVGTTAQRAPEVNGAIRLNSSTWQFEGFSGKTDLTAGNWASLGGVRSVDGFTYISAELAPNQSDDTLRFYTGNVAGTGSDLTVTIDSSTVEIKAATTASVTEVEGVPVYDGALVVEGGVLVKDNLIVLGGFTATGAVNYNDPVTFLAPVTVDSEVYSTLDTFNLLNSSGVGEPLTNDGPTTVNAFLNATTINIGSTAEGGLVTLNGDLQVVGNDISSSNGTTAITLQPIEGGTNVYMPNSLELGENLHVIGTSDLDGTTTIGLSGTRANLTVYGDVVDIDAVTSSTLSVSGNSVNATDITISAVNAGDGEANVDISAKTDISLTSATVTLDIGTSVTSNAPTTTLETNTLTITHSGGNTGTSTVDIYGNVTVKSNGGTSSLTVDNIVIDGNTISSKDISNVLIIDPAPLEGVPSSLLISATGTIGSITGEGPWNAVITGMTTTTGLAVGSTISATNGAGSLGDGGTYVIDRIISNTSVSFVATGGTTPVAGAVTNINETNEQGLVIIKGNLQVDGVTTTVNSTTVTIDDPVFTLGGEGTPTVSDPYDRGIEFKWIDDTATASLGFFGWDRSANEFVFIDHAATPTANSFVPDTGKSYSDIRIGSATLVDTTASTDTITGALVVGGGAGFGGQINVGGAQNKFTGTTDAIKIVAGAYSSADNNAGTIIVSGGVNIAKSLYVDDHIVGAPPVLGAYSSVIENFVLDGGTF